MQENEQRKCKKTPKIRVRKQCRRMNKEKVKKKTIETERKKEYYLQ